MTFAEHVVTVFIGSFFGFLFGLILFWVREYILEKKKRDMAKKTLIFLLRELSMHLVHKPKNYTHISAEPALEYLKYFLNDKTMVEPYDCFLLFHSHWREGNYLKDGLKVDDIENDTKKLSDYLNSLKAIKPILLQRIWECIKCT
jgi:hypothetical protein